MEDSFSVSIPGGCQWQALWNLRTGRGHCPPALYQVWKCLHWNMSGLHQRPSGQHRNQSHQSHRWRGTQVQRAHWEETGTQVSILLLLWDWCCTLLYRRGCMQQHKQKGRDFSGILWMTKLSQQLASPHPVTVFALKAISCLLPANQIETQNKFDPWGDLIVFDLISLCYEDRSGKHPLFIGFQTAAATLLANQTLWSNRALV